MRIFWLSAISLLLTSCEHRAIIHPDDPALVQIQLRTNELKLASISIMDRNGLSETISAKERLKNYENVSFLTAQPYQKVLRVYAKDKSGNTLSIITSYYPSGQIKQHLECINGRACGQYIEWHTNGKKKLQSSVLGGAADLDEKSQTSWVFHETSLCWNEDGVLIAKMPYVQGLLEGLTTYYHPSGAISEEIPYHKGEIEGEAKIFDDKTVLLESTYYVHDRKSGRSCGFWTSSQCQWDEQWQEGHLQQGKYFSKDDILICQVENGSGRRAIFGDSAPIELQEYHKGSPEGEVVIFDDKGRVVRRLQVKDGEKNGEEIHYWTSDSAKPKLSIQWVNDQIHGPVKTWYEDGTPECSREMSHNLKQGMMTAWYKDGKLMLIEEYEKDRLIRGDYIKKGETKPITQVIDGKGIATFYDADGTFRGRISYLDGKPVLDDLVAER